MRINSLPGALLVAAPLAISCTDSVDEELEPALSTTESSITVSGLGVYCSTVFPDASSGLKYEAAGDPCGELGGTVKHKGLYALDGWNNVVLACTTNLFTSPPTVARWGWRGWGEAPMQWARTKAASYPTGACHYTINPNELPILRQPFDDAGPGEKPRSCAGFNYARKYPVSALEPYGGTINADTVTNLRRQPLANGSDVGHDCYVPRGTPLKAMAAGTVIQAHCWDTDATFPDGTPKSENGSSYTPNGESVPAGFAQQQRDVVIEHVVQGPTAGYEERFYTVYAHLDTIGVKAGDHVSQGQVIGTSGTSGLSGGDHLHFSVNRRTNTIDKLIESFDVPTNNSIVTCGSTADSPNSGPPHNVDQMIIDPWGWRGENMFDPWSLKPVPWTVWGWGGSYTAGALSLNLWMPGWDPPVREDWRFVDGTYQIKTQSAWNQCMDLAYDSTADGIDTQARACSTATTQRWEFRKVAVLDGKLSEYEIRNAATGKCLDVAGGSWEPGAAVQQWTCNNTVAQRFVLGVDDAARLTFYPQVLAYPQRCIEVDPAGGFRSEYCTGTSSQKLGYVLAE